MTRIQINLASRPFANYTLYYLSFAVIGLAGVALLLHNVAWIAMHLGDLRGMEGEITQLSGEVQRNINRSNELAGEIGRLQKNRKFIEVVGFVDGRVRQRRFSWIRMINRLGEALPDDVKVEVITPRVQKDSIRITLQCVARREESIDQFIEALEGMAEFDRVFISSEEKEGPAISFPLIMDYSPYGFGEAEEEPAAGAPASEADLCAALAEAVGLALLPDPAAGGTAGLLQPEAEGFLDLTAGENPLGAAGTLGGPPAAEAAKPGFGAGKPGAPAAAPAGPPSAAGAAGGGARKPGRLQLGTAGAGQSGSPSKPPGSGKP